MGYLYLFVKTCQSSLRCHGRCDDGVDVVLIVFPPNPRPQTRLCADMRLPTLMSSSHEAEVLFISRRKSDLVAYHRDHHAPDTTSTAATASTRSPVVGFQAHFSFLPGSSSHLVISSSLDLFVSDDN